MNLNRLNRRQCRDVIPTLQQFFNSTRSLRGYKRTPDYDPGNHLTGRLNAVERTLFLSDAQHGIDYLVVSYSTPIAWVSRGEWYRVEQRFSSTTSCHQGMCPRTGTPVTVKADA